MTLKNNRAPLLCYGKLCAAFESHQWIQTGVTGLGSNKYLYLNTQISVFVFVFVFEKPQDEIFVFVFVFDWHIWVYLSNIFQIHFSFCT